MRQVGQKSRPWTVYLLVLLSVAGVAWSAIVDPDRNLWDVVGALVTLWITYSLWTGKQWAFTLSFMLATLCAGLALVSAVAQAFLLEGGVDERVLWTLGGSVVWTLLLLHPATKEFSRSAGDGQTTERDDRPAVPH